MCCYPFQYNKVYKCKSIQNVNYCKIKFHFTIRDLSFGCVIFESAEPILVGGQHEAIISDELWSIVQARRKSKSFKQLQSNKPFLLSDLIRCPDGGQRMVPSINTHNRQDGKNTPLLFLW